TQAIAGTGFSMAFGSDGNLYNWGDNEYGELGRPTDADNNVPVGLAGKPADAKPSFTWTQASAGMNHTLAMGSDGKLYSWGNNFNQPARSSRNACRRHFHSGRCRRLPLHGH
ncbi:MAG: hypothetical protein M3Z40_07550, partial [Bifidobacterium sp.]|nr:hypothetical protein [Bifidobacterium sp.]